MKNVSKKEFIIAMAQWRLAQSISHMKDQTGIDQRTYMLTVNLKRNSTPSVIADNCYQTIKHHLKFGMKGDTPQHRLPGLLWSYDASGSRTGRISELNNHPHIHAILILPKKMGRYEIGPLIHSLEQDIVKLPGVAPLSGASRPVDLMPFVVRTHDGSASLYEQFIDFCSYAIKGEALLSQSHHHSPDFLTSGTFPMDIFNHAARRQLEENVQRVSKNLQSPSTRFRHISKLN